MRVKARAYASSANLGPGFDALALAVDAFYDEVTVETSPKPGVELVSVEGPYSGGVDIARNTATASIKELLRITGMNGEGLRVTLWKGVPPGRGLGSSGASAAAAVKAAATLLGLDAPLETLVRAAGLGEAASSGSPHYDNVAASLLGGLAVVGEQDGSIVVAGIEARPHIVLGIPFNEVPPNKTREMRRVLPDTVGFKAYVHNTQRLALLLAGFAMGDYRLAGLGMDDRIVEPRRKQFVPCYEELRQAAYRAGAAGFTISGAGPSVIALAETPGSAELIARAMKEAYTSCGTPFLVVPARGALGATVLQVI